MFMVIREEMWKKKKNEHFSQITEEQKISITNWIHCTVIQHPCVTIISTNKLKQVKKVVVKN